MFFYVKTLSFLCVKKLSYRIMILIFFDGIKILVKIEKKGHLNGSKFFYTKNLALKPSLTKNRHRTRRTTCPPKIRIN
jgi:hypothetical protein